MARRSDKKLEDSSPLVIFILYLGAAFAVICAYQFISPPKITVVEILGCFRFSWCFTNGIITFIGLFPALAFSGLVIPFGLKEHSEGGYAGSAFVGNKGFSSDFLKYLSWPIITAALSAVTYSLLFFLVLPFTINLSNSIQDRSDLFAKAKQRAEEKAAAMEWAEASQFVEICESIWPDNEAISKFKIKLVDSFSKYRQSLEESKTAEETKEDFVGIHGDPVYAADAIRLAEAAFAEEKYYEAHWLATLAEKLAKKGSAETGAAVALASRAWEKITLLEPSAQEKEKYSLYNMKRDAYEAMNAGNWINAFYAFSELFELTPKDPDVIKYLELCKTGVGRAAFFIDELDLSIGSTLIDSVFSIPAVTGTPSAGAPAPGILLPDGGRYIIRFNSLALLKDNAYAWGAEVIAAGRDGALRYRVSSDYAKLIPIGGSNGEEKTSDKTVLLLQALDRTDKTKGSAPVWTSEGAQSDPLIGANQILLPINFDDFLLLSKARQGSDTLGFHELFTAEKTFSDFGYIRESFSAEILRRLGNVLLFLPIAIMALILGWRYRARKKPRYVYVPMLFLLPVVFSGAVLFYQAVINNLSVWLSLSLGLTTALICLCAFSGIFFIAALILLAAQHG